MTSASLTFLAHHEFRLAWRDWWSMLTAGRRKRARVVIFVIVAFAVAMHFIALSVVGQFAELAPDADRGTLVVITGCALLAWSLMMSQAMEQVTRAFYARSDLDLILSSPTASRRVFAVRIGAMAISTMMMAVLLAAPFINVLIWHRGARWWSAYGVVAAVGAVAASLSVALTVFLFRTIGPKRTRLAAQIVAAIVGAIFVIGLQIAAILSYGTLSYFTFLKSEQLVAYVPAVESFVWWPARAVLGDFTALEADNPHILAYLRSVRPEEVLDDEDDRETVLCVNNLASRPQAAKIQLPPEFAGRRLKDLFGGSGFPPVAEDGTVWLTFGSRDFFWLKAVPDPAKEAAHG